MVTKPRRTRKPRITLWTIRKGPAVLTCEIRTDGRTGAAVDVEILDLERAKVFRQRCTDRRHADGVAELYLQDFLAAGWAEGAD